MRNTAAASTVLAIILLSIKCVAFATPDPTTVSTSTSQYATALGNSRKLFRDAYGKYIAVHKSSNVYLDYCNNDPPTSGWSSNDLGSSYAVDSGEQFGVAAAYDNTNDKLMIAWTSSGNFKAAQITFTRSGGSITGYTAGSVLSITPTYGVCHAPSLWLLHNGEVAAVWGSDTTGGAKHSYVEFCRLVFGSPPTYKNAAGTASSTDLLGADYRTSIVIRMPTIVERTNSGTGQYDIWCIWTSEASYSIAAGRVKATWSSPNWAWETVTEFTYGACGPTANYDSTNGLVVYAYTLEALADTVIKVFTISSSDTVTEITKTGLTSSRRKCMSLAINEGDYYFFYYNFITYQNLYYIRRMAGTWDSDETCFTSGGGSVWHHYASYKVDGAGNRIELIWTYYTISTTYVYYDYLAAPSPFPTRTINTKDFALIDDVSKAIGTGETTLATISTSFPAGNNFVLAIVEFQSGVDLDPSSRRTLQPAI